MSNSNLIFSAVNSDKIDMKMNPYVTQKVCSSIFLRESLSDMPVVDCYKFLFIRKDNNYSVINSVML